jgi:hypothetical protein
VATLFIARGAETDGTNGVRQHVVGMLLMDLNIALKFESF